MHLELVTDLITEAFVACVRRFVACHSLPSVNMSGHVTNFVGDDQELGKFYTFINSNPKVTEFCTSQGIKWKYIPEKSPHFGGLWEAAVKSAKTCQRKVADIIRMSQKELANPLSQIEACYSRPVIPLLTVDSERVEPFTPRLYHTGRSYCPSQSRSQSQEDCSAKMMADVSTD